MKVLKLRSLPSSDQRIPRPIGHREVLQRFLTKPISRNRRSHQDTLDAGDGLCDEDVVRMVVEEAGERILDLLSIGVEFERNKDGAFQLAQEGGHSSRRILHAKDATGREIERALTTAAREHDESQCAQHACNRPIQRQHKSPSKGVVGLGTDQDTNQVMTIVGDAVILATGGGQLWRRRQILRINWRRYAMAYRTGASIINMAFVQFHPTHS